MSSTRPQDRRTGRCRVLGLYSRFAASGNAASRRHYTPLAPAGTPASSRSSINLAIAHSTAPGVNIGVRPSLAPCTSAGTHTSVIPRRYKVSRRQLSLDERTHIEVLLVQIHEPTLEMHQMADEIRALPLIGLIPPAEPPKRVEYGLNVIRGSVAGRFPIVLRID
jgi:hypothetical protein